MYPLSSAPGVGAVLIWVSRPDSSGLQSRLEAGVTAQIGTLRSVRAIGETFLIG